MIHQDATLHVNNRTMLVCNSIYMYKDGVSHSCHAGSSMPISAQGQAHYDA